MLEFGARTDTFTLPALTGNSYQLGGVTESTSTIVVFFETDCPTCQMAMPYLNTLAERIGSDNAQMFAVSQDGLLVTKEFVRSIPISFPVLLDSELTLTKIYDPQAVPTIFLLDNSGIVQKVISAFDKAELNDLAKRVGELSSIEAFVLADEFDGNPAHKFGCVSRHLEPRVESTDGQTGFLNIYQQIGQAASRIELQDEADAMGYCLENGFDPLPVIPPTAERVLDFIKATRHKGEDIVALIPPNYGQATIEKIAANAVMAGCKPELMRVLLPLIRAVCDERFNIHGVQATTHFAAPLVIINGPIRAELGFWSKGNVFSNIARANSSLGRALQLLLINIGGARPGEIDMSTLGNSGKYSYCIAENEEENPWEPLQVEMGFSAAQSTVTLFAAEPPRGVSEHNARKGRTVLKAISRALATVWSYRACGMFEAIVVLCPEHVKTLQRDGYSKESIREFLFEFTAIPMRHFDDEDGEGVQVAHLFQRVTVDGEECYRKFARPEQIKIVVAGGTAGKFSAVIGSWATGPRGSQMVTYPIE